MYRKSKASEEPNLDNVTPDPEDLVFDNLNTRLSNVKEFFKELSTGVTEIETKLKEYRDEGIKKIEEGKEDKSNDEGK